MGGAYVGRLPGAHRRSKLRWGQAMDGDAIVVTGIGAISAVGAGAGALAEAVAAGRSGIGPLRRIDASFLPGAVAGEVPGLGADEEPCVVFAGRAAREAWEGAGRPDPRGIAVIAGSSSGPHGSEEALDALEASDPIAAARIKRRDRHGAVAVAAAEAIGAGGPRITMSTACASGLSALALGLDLLRSGAADAVLAGGAEGLSARRLAGFAALGALAPGPCAPFSTPVGMSLGEGSAFLMIERASRARARGAPILGWLLGSGSASDAWHATAPEPRGEGIARAVSAALADAGLGTADIDWISAHATGTEANDGAEWLGLCRVFGAPPCVSGVKSFFGHTFGAAGALEAAVAVQALRAQAAPPTLRFVGPRAIGPTDPVGEGVPRRMRLRSVLLCNAAFGGANAAVVLGEAPSARDVVDRVVHVSGIGSSAADEPDDPEVRLRDRPPDPAARLLARAVHRALRDAGVRVDRASRDRVGLWVAAARRPVDASRAYRQSILARGLSGASAAAFARTVMNAAGGAAGRALSLRGPTATVSAGPCSALIALIGAAGLVRRGAADRMVVGAADELDPVLAALDPETDGPAAPGGPRWGAGGAAVVLGDSGPVRLAGFGLAGPGGLADAIRRAGAGRPDRVWSAALGPLGVAREEAAVREVLGQIALELPEGGRGESLAGLVSLSGAYARLIREGGTALVVSDDLEIGAVAVALSAVAP